MVVVISGLNNAHSNAASNIKHGMVRASEKITRPTLAACSVDLCDPSNSAALGGASFKLNVSNDSGFLTLTQSLYALVADQAEEDLIDDVSDVVQNFAPTFTIAAIQSHQETDWVNHPTYQHEQAHGLQTFLNTFWSGLHCFGDLVNSVYTMYSQEPQDTTYHVHHC